jgi:uncharacterized protein
MDTTFVFNDVSFIWDTDKAAANVLKHGISFEQAATVFFDPFFRLIDASRNDEARDALIGYSDRGSLLYVVHIQRDDERIRLISARSATNDERRDHENF